MPSRSPRFDYNVNGVPMMLYRTDRIESVMHAALDDGKGPYETFELMKDEQVRQLREDADYRAELRTVYRQAGVNVFSPTVDARSLPRWQARESILDWLHTVTTPAEVQSVIDDGDVAMVMNTQNLGELIGDDLAGIERYYNQGIRIGQLTYNTQNLLGAGCTERGDGGLTKRGVDAVATMNNLGFVVDLAHCGERTTLDAIEVSERPVAITHSGCASVAPHPRVKSDAVLEALAANDGYLGLVMIASFVASGREDEVVDVFFEQLEHARSILGLDRIGLASDWVTMAPTTVPERLQERIEPAYLDGYDWDPEHNPKVAQGFGPINRYSDLAKLRAEFEERGYSDAEIDRVFGRNFIEFWERATQ
ncbi:MAG: dipeptidase [Halobacteriales archaeon]